MAECDAVLKINPEEERDGTEVLQDGVEGGSILQRLMILIEDVVFRVV